MSEFEKQITPKTKGIVIVNPNNPTGYLYSPKELEELAKIVKNTNYTYILTKSTDDIVMMA